MKTKWVKQLNVTEKHSLYEQFDAYLNVHTRVEEKKQSSQAQRSHLSVELETNSHVPFSKVLNPPEYKEQIVLTNQKSKWGNPN